MNSKTVCKKILGKKRETEFNERGIADACMFCEVGVFVVKGVLSRDWPEQQDPGPRRKSTS
jgi:hypothetical protein